MNEALIKNVRKHVKELFNDKYDEKSVYHSYDHTREVVAAADKIGQGNDLSDEDLEIVIIAGWLHDTGYLFSQSEHELESVRIAEEFLKSEKYPKEKVRKVADCILATRMNHKPTSLLEEVMQDADFSGLGSEDNFKQSKLLRAELANYGLKVQQDEEWLIEELNFLQNHQYHTPFARQGFAEQKADNIKKLKKKLRKYKERMELISGVTLIDEKEKRKGEEKKEKEERELRKEIDKKESLSIKGFESIFKLTSANHMRLNAIADRKAGLMLSLSGIIISISMGVLAPKLDTNPQLIIPTCILILTSLVTIIFATLSTRPKINSGMFSKEDIEGKKANLLFFGNFARMNFEDFDWGLKRMIKDQDYLHGSMIQDFYSLGKVLFKKFHFLRICYNVFMYGMIISVIAFVIAFALGEQPGVTSTP